LKFSTIDVTSSLNTLPADVGDRLKTAVSVRRSQNGMAAGNALLGTMAKAPTGGVADIYALRMKFAESGHSPGFGIVARPPVSS
jgi:hypothetical protein